MSRAGVTIETIDAVLAHGRYQVRGVALPVSGRAHLQAGQRVPVAWRRGRPALILAHSARRAKPSAPPDRADPAVVEELFLAPNPPGGLDVWFRNQDTVQPLGLRGQLPEEPTGVKWGQDRDSFVVRMGDRRYAVFAFTREQAHAPFDGDQAPVPTLVATDDLFAPQHVLLDGTFTRQGTGTRITATQTWEETHKATIQSFTIQNPGTGNDPDECLIVAISTTCRTAAAYQEFLDNANFHRAEMPEPPGCVDPDTGHQLEVLSFVASPPPEDAHLGILKKHEGAVSVNTVVHRLVILNQALYDAVAAVEGSGGTPEFTPLVQDYYLTADRKVIVTLLLRVAFTGDIQGGDTQAQSSVAYRYPESFQDPNWVTPLQPIAQSADTAPNIKAAFDIRETHAYVFNVTDQTLLWATTGAHLSPVKTRTITESYATLDTKSGLSQQAFDGPWLNWDRLVSTGIEPSHSGTKIGTAGQVTLTGAWSHVIGDPLFIGIGLSTMEVRRVIAVSGLVNTLDAPLTYDHYDTEPIRPVPALVYWETQQTGDPACEIRRSLVDTVEPSNAHLDGARTTTLGTIGTQGRSGFQNDLWGAPEIDTSDQYAALTTYSVTGTPHFNSANSLTSVPLKYGDDFFTGLDVTWSFEWQWTRQLKRYRVQDMRLITWHPQPPKRRWWLVLEAYHLVTGVAAVRGLVLDGSFTLVSTTTLLDNATVALLAATPHHLVWHEQAPTAQRLVVADLDRGLSTTYSTGATPNLKTRWQSPDLRALPPDLLFRSQPDGEEDFAKGWDPRTGAVLVDPLAGNFPVTDEELRGRGDLADLPAAVAGIEPTAPRHHQALNQDEEFGPEPELGSP